jgi:hypothetical protein
LVGGKAPSSLLQRDPSSISVAKTNAVGIAMDVCIAVSIRVAARTAVRAAIAARIVSGVTEFITVTVPLGAGGPSGSSRVTEQITDQDADRGPDHDAGQRLIPQYRLNRGKTLAALPTNLIGGTLGGVPHLPGSLTPVLVYL